LQIHIQNSSVLDKIKFIFKNSLEGFREDINSASSSFKRIIEDTNSKISRIRSIIQKLEGEISVCIGRLSFLNSQMNSYLSSASSARSNAYSCHHEDNACRNRYESLARDYAYKADQVRAEINITQSKLQQLQSTKSIEESREQKAKSVLSSAKAEYDKYDNLRAEVNANSNSIFDATSQKLQAIKSKLNNYVDVQSDISNSTSSSENSASLIGNSANIVTDETDIGIDDYLLVLNNDTYNVKSLKVGKRFKCSVEKNSTPIDLKFNFKSLSDSVELLSFSSKNDDIDMKIIEKFLLSQARKNNVTIIDTWADLDEIECLKTIGFEIKSIQIDGAEMFKKI